jgi:NAD(P)-dependent dehydrogenase (short-subunit alcohol dehydrogenase family)
MEFQDKVCVVTGGANGIGRALVYGLLREGAYVAFADTDKEAGGRIAAENPARTLFLHGDIAQQPALDAFARAVLGRFARVDCLVNNACVTRRGLLSGCTFEQFDYVMRLGVAAPYELTRLFMHSFGPDAAIVNIASSRAFMSQADTESYSAAKGGILALTHAMAVSLCGRARVNAVCPGWIETAAYQGDGTGTAVHSEADKLQHPTGRVGEPKDIVDSVLFLLSPRAGFITGASLTVDGGMTKNMIYHGDGGWTFNPATVKITD